MKYLKVIFNLTDSNKNTISDKLMAQASKDVLCDNLADIGFEAFENDEKEGETGYVQQNVFDENLLKGCICDFPIGNVIISYTVQEAEDKNWNEAWEETGFEPIAVKGKFIIPHRFRLKIRILRGKHIHFAQDRITESFGS